MKQDDVIRMMQPGDVSFVAPGQRMYLEREVIYRERAAFIEGRRAVQADGRSLENWAALRYPLPKVTRPREKTDSRGVTWRVLAHQFRDPVIEYRDESRPGIFHTWRDALSAGPGQPCLTVEVARIITELAANPTEEVEAE